MSSPEDPDIGTVPQVASLPATEPYLIFVGRRKACGCIVAVTVVYRDGKMRKLFSYLQEWLNRDLMVAIWPERTVGIGPLCEQCRRTRNELTAPETTRNAALHSTTKAGL